MQQRIVEAKETVPLLPAAQGRRKCAKSVASGQYPGLVRCLFGRRPATNGGRSNQDSLSAESTFFLWGSTEKSAELRIQIPLS